MPKQNASGGFSAKLRDPVTGARVVISGDTEADFIARAERWRALRRDVKLGLGDLREQRAVMRALTEGPFTVERAWAEAIAKKDDYGRTQHKNTWARVFKPIIGARALGDLTEEVMVEWEIWAAKQNGPNGRPPKCSTIRNWFNMLRAAVNVHVPDRIAFLPFGKWVPTGLGEPAGGPRAHLRSIEEMKAVILEARRRDTRLRAQWVTHGFADLENRVTLALFCGLRNAELGAIGWDDIQFDEGETGGLLTPRYQVQTGWKKKHPTWTRPMTPPKSHRGDKPRAVKPQRLHPNAVRALLSQRAELQRLGWYRPDGPVFPRPQDGTWRGDNCTIKPELTRELVRATGIDIDLARVVTHSTRHTFSTLECAAIMNAGGTLRDVAERTRHQDMKVLQGYIHAIGKGLVPPVLPALDLSPLPELQRGTVDAEFEVIEAPHVERITKERGQQIEAARLAEKIVADETRYSRGESRDWTSQAKAWIAAGKPPPRPKAITRDFERAYTRAYVTESRLGGDKAAARKKGLAAKKGSEMRWARLVRTLEGHGVLKGSSDATEAIQAHDRSAPRDLRGAFGAG